jgi:hypothetical protein
LDTLLRVGEILGLYLSDIGEKYLDIFKSYSRADGIKGTKTDFDRSFEGFCGKSGRTCPKRV